jgi:tetratricopeptide (TPR) repeat protein
VITLLPVIGLVQVGGQSMADRYSYVPYTGVFIALAWGLADIAGQAMRTRVIASVLCVAMLLVCAHRTWVEVSYWRDSETLWERSLAVTTDNFPAHLNLALLDVRQKRRESAAKHLEAALRIAPYDTIALNDYGLVLLELGRYSEAAEQFELALRSLPGDAKLHIAMAVALEKQGKRSEAIQQMNEAHRLDPSMDVKSILNKTLRAVDAAKL